MPSPDPVRAGSGPLRVGLIGFGSIGRPVALAILDGTIQDAVLSGVLRSGRGRSGSAASGEDGLLSDLPFVATLDELLATGPHVVVEVGGHAALRAHGLDVLESGADLITVSVGALADDALLHALEAAARSAGGRLLVPSGAIAGLDMLSASQLGGLDQVRHTVRKPPMALLPTDEAATVIAGGTPRTLYEGPAREAVSRFPENVNVVAAVSLAGLGLDRTIARVIADPDVTHNTHEIEASGTFGRLQILVQNVPGPNPKTGRIVAPSVIRALQRLRASVVFAA